MKYFRRWLWGMVVAVLLLGARGTAVAQTPSLESSVDYAYGQRVTFRLTGQMPEAIEKIELFVNLAQAETPLSVDVRFSQENSQLIAGYDLDPTLAGLPPFGQVVYWWALTTANSATLTVPEARFTYRDDRFDWRELAQADLTVYWTGNDANLGQTAWEIADDSREKLDHLLPPTAVSPLNVYIYPSTADLRAGLRLAGRDWQDGHVDPDLDVLLVTAVNPLTAAADLSQTIPHELTHLRLHRLSETAVLPFWYEEGLALVAAEADAGSAELVAEAVANDTALTLLSLCTAFPQAEAEEELALAQSSSVLRYIQAQFGDQALRQLGANYLAGAGCEAGLSQTLGISLAELNADWQAAQRPQPAWRTFLSQNGLWLLLLLVSFGFLALLLRR